MKQIVFATTNEAKVKQLQGALAPIGVAVTGVKDKASFRPVEEYGNTAQENARKKAVTYARQLGVTVLSMDNALYFDKLPLAEQPGLHVRRIGRGVERPSDHELLTYYAGLIRKFGEQTTGRWEFAICVATPDGVVHETTIVSPRTFTSVPSSKIIDGYPLESIQIDPTSGKYISEMSQAEQDIFWQDAIGKPLQNFILNIPL